MAVTIKDIALLAGVSHQAVSAALKPTPSGRVSAATREKILRIARELNYVPNAAARTLNAGSTRTIGILGNFFSNLHGSYYDEIAAIFAVEGYHVLNSYCDFRSGIRPALEPLLAAGATGILVMAPSNRAELDRALPVPYVYWNNLPPEASDVYVDLAAGFRLALNHLRGHGRRRIAFLEPQKDPIRRPIVERAAAECGVESLHFLNLREFGGSFPAVLETLRQKRINGILASNDYVGAKFLKCCFDHGVNIPQEFAVIGHDGYSFTEFAPRTLTTLIQPVRKQAEAASRLLLERIAGNCLHCPPAGIRIEPELHCGSSCGCEQPPLDRLYQTNTYPLLESDRRVNFPLNASPTQQPSSGSFKSLDEKNEQFK